MSTTTLVYRNGLDWSYPSDRKKGTSVIPSNLWQSGELFNIAVGVVPVTLFCFLCIFPKKISVSGLECLSHRVAKL